MPDSVFIVPFVRFSPTLARMVERIRAAADRLVVLIEDPPCSGEEAGGEAANSVAERRVSIELAEAGTILLKNSRHAGYTRSVNAAIAWAWKNVDFADLWIANDDISFVRGLPDIPDPPPDAGLIGVLSNKAGYQSISYCLDNIGDYLYPDADPETVAEGFDLGLSKRGERFVPVPLVHGFCFRTSRRCLQTVGLLDERGFVFGYGSDYDLSLRTVRAGFTNYVHTGSFVAHIGAASSGRATRRIHAIRADHQLRSTYGEEYRRAKFVTRERLNRHLANYVHLTAD